MFGSPMKQSKAASPAHLVPADLVNLLHYTCVTPNSIPTAAVWSVHFQLTREGTAWHSCLQLKHGDMLRECHLTILIVIDSASSQFRSSRLKMCTGGVSGNTWAPCLTACTQVALRDWVGQCDDSGPSLLLLGRKYGSWMKHHGMTPSDTPMHVKS